MTHAGGKKMETELLRRNAELLPANAPGMGCCRTVQGSKATFDHEKAPTPHRILSHYEEV
jgi:hypothetical protein